MTGKEAPNKRNMQKFVRYAEGAKMYSMGLSKFQELGEYLRHTIGYHRIFFTRKQIAAWMRMNEHNTRCI